MAKAATKPQTKHAREHALGYVGAKKKKLLKKSDFIIFLW